MQRIISVLCRRFTAAPQARPALKVFDRTAASTGISERTARGLGIDCAAVILSPLSHASYYPGAQVMTLKLVFETPSGKLLGAQIVGGDGVDKRIDVLATAIQAGLTAFDLCDLELSYAPPYSSAKDPVNIAGLIPPEPAYGEGQTDPLRRSRRAAAGRAT